MLMPWLLDVYVSSRAQYSVRLASNSQVSTKYHEYQKKKEPKLFGSINISNNFE